MNHAHLRQRVTSTIAFYADRRGLSLDELAAQHDQHRGPLTQQLQAQLPGKLDENAVGSLLKRLQGGHPAHGSAQIARALDDVLLAQDQRRVEVQSGLGATLAESQGGPMRRDVETTPLYRRLDPGL